MPPGTGVVGWGRGKAGGGVRRLREDLGARPARAAGSASWGFWMPVMPGVRGAETLVLLVEMGRLGAWVMSGLGSVLDGKCALHPVSGAAG